MSAIQTEELNRRFGDRNALGHLTLDLPAGGAIGLVGPNGSGKSTLIRILLGLIRPSGGSATVLGASIDDQVRIAGRIGALIESPAFVPALTARANLRSLAQLRGLGMDRVDRVLDQVGLTGRDREPVKGFSLGMKQRLGIAAALLPDPELLILDEPTNGLDPAGIVEIRGLLRTLGQQGRTVVVSSHLLSEIQAVCDYVVIIRFGVLIFAGSIDDLLARAAEHIEVAPEHPADAVRLRQVLADAGWRGTALADGTLRLDAPTDQTAAVNRAAVAGGITLSRLTATAESLEELFLELTASDPGEPGTTHPAGAARPPAPVNSGPDDSRIAAMQGGRR